MTKTVFIASAEPDSGKSLVALGLLHWFLSQGKKAAFFKPIVNTAEGEKNTHIDTVSSYFQLDTPYRDLYACTRTEAMRHFENDTQGELIDTVISKVKDLESAYDFVVAEGSDFTGEGTAFELETNVLVARNLGAPALLVVSGENKTTAQVLQSALTLLHTFQQHRIVVTGLIANRVKPSLVEELSAAFAAGLPETLQQIVIPCDIRLHHPTVNDIFKSLGGKLLFGAEHLGNRVDNFVTGAMQVPNFLNHLRENVLIITPGDRADILMASLQANLSDSYPHIAGVVLTAGIAPEEPVIRLIEGLKEVVPVISVSTGTFRTVADIAAVKPRITADNPARIDAAIQTFYQFAQPELLAKQIIDSEGSPVTPHLFQYRLAQWAGETKKRIVLPEGNDDRILKAAAKLVEKDIAELLLLGNIAQIDASISRLGLDSIRAHVTIIDPEHSAFRDEFSDLLYQLRAAKGMTRETAHELTADVSYFGTLLVQSGRADGMVSGAVHTTQHTIKPALQIIKTRPGISVVSSVFLMCMDDRVCVFGDCAVNPNPTAEQLCEIAISSADTSTRFGIPPLIAMLSYSSGNSGVGEDVEKVRRATELVRQKRPDLPIEGPIQYDAAVDPAVGRQKMPGSTVAGRATVFIFPDLNTGNNTYKAVQRETGALAIGPVLQGLNKPVNDLSRGCSVDDIFNTVLITAIQSQHSPIKEEVHV